MKALSIIGFAGSGKSTVGLSLAKALNVPHIETSDIVRHLTGMQDRIQMYTTSTKTTDDPDWLGFGLYNAIRYVDKAIITGVREKEVHNYLYKAGVNLRIISLYCPENERFKRLSEDKRVTSYQDFKEQEHNELDMGLGELLSKSYPEFCTTSHRSIDTVVQEIVDELLPNWEVTRGTVLSN